MKRFLLVLGIICLLSFSLAGCSEAPDNKDANTDKTVEESRKPLASGIEKPKEEVAKAKKGDQQVIENRENMPEKVVESKKKETPDSIDAAKDRTPDAVKAAAPIASPKSNETLEVVEMKHTDAFSAHKMGIVMFSHKKHTSAKPTGYGIVCGECHHDKDGKPLELKEGDAVQGCMECHDKAGKPQKPEGTSKKDWDAMQLKYYYGAIHANCINCHKAGGAGPVKCAECHPKPGK